MVTWCYLPYGFFCYSLRNRAAVVDHIARLSSAGHVSVLFRLCCFLLPIFCRLLPAVNCLLYFLLPTSYFLFPTSLTIISFIFSLLFRIYLLQKVLLYYPNHFQNPPYAKPLNTMKKEKAEKKKSKKKNFKKKIST